MSFFKRISDNRGAIVLETALCLPIYFILLAILVDVPLIMSYRQSLLGIARLHADIGARNDGTADILDEELCRRLFLDQSTKIISVQNLDNMTERNRMVRKSSMARIFTFQNSDGDSSGTAAQIKNMLGSVFNVLLAGAPNHYLDNVFATDVFYCSQPQLFITTILPPDFYAYFLETDGEECLCLSCPVECWQPSADSAQDVGETPFAKIGQMINDSLGFIRHFVKIPAFADFSP
ncbi:MAG: TadE/TadG family type IV pilus assembly protein [Lentisphaeria bacterium]|jgi:hypothetical protein